MDKDFKIMKDEEVPPSYMRSRLKGPSGIFIKQQKPKINPARRVGNIYDNINFADELGDCDGED